MPIYSITAPNGRIYEIEGPEGASREAVIAEILRRDPSAAQPAPTGKAPTSGSDLLTALQMGAIGSAKALTDVAGADNVASQYLQGKLEATRAEYTPERQAELARQAERMKQAEASGSFLEEAKAAVQNVAEAPLQTGAQAVGSFAPYIAAALAPKVAAVAGLVGLTSKGAAATAAVTRMVPRIMTAMGTAQGAGAVKGAIYDGVYQAEREAGVPEAQARDKARAAQAYMGENLDQILLGAGLGAVSAGSGVEKLLTPAGAAGAATKMIPRVARAAGTEFLTEGTQGGQEQLAENLALQRAGYDVPTLRGVAGAATGEGLAGLLGAAPVAAIRGPGAPAPAQPPAPTPPAAAAPTAEQPPEAAAEPQEIAEPAAGEVLVPEIEQRIAWLESKGRMIEARELREAGPKLREQAARAEARRAKTAAAAETAQILEQAPTQTYEELQQTRAALDQMPDTPQVRAARKQLTAQLRALDAQQIEARRRGEALAKTSAFQEAQPDLFGLAYPPAEPPAVEEAAPVEPPVSDPRQMRLFERQPVQRDLLTGELVMPEAEPTPAVEEAPTRPDLRADALQMPLDLRQRRAKRAAPSVIVPQGEPDVAQEPTRGGVRPEPEAAVGAAQPGVEALEQPGAGPAVPDAQGAVAPDRAGVATVPVDAGVEPVSEGATAPAVNPDAAVRSAWDIPKKSQLLMEQEAQQTGTGRRVQGTRYRTPDAQPAPKQPIADAELSRIVTQVTRSLGLPENAITIMDDVRQFDTSQEPGSRAGVTTPDGHVRLFRDGISSGVEGQKTVFHELLHRGLRYLLPADEYATSMLRLYVQHESLRKAANKWLQDPQNQADLDKAEKKSGRPLTQRMRRAIATEEALAELAETRKPPSMIRSLGNWLANLAARMGMPALARSIRTMGMTELEAFVDTALRATGPAPMTAEQTGVRYSTKKQPPTATARQVDTMLTALDMQPTPQASKLAQAGSVVSDAVQNPTATAATFAKATSSFLDKFGNAFFSGNFALQRAFRKQLQDQLSTNPAATGMLLATSDAQVDGSAVLAGLFAREGNLEYNPALYKWEATRSTSLADLAKTISDMAATHGLTKEQASQVMDSYFEARRTEGLAANNAQWEQTAQMQELAGYPDSAAKSRENIVQHLKDPGWVAQAMQFGQMFPELQTAAEQWNAVRANTVKIMVDSGLWTPEMAEIMLSAAEYVPFYREEQLEAGKGPREFISGLQVKAREARLKGSERKVNDVFDNMMRWTQYAIERSVRNHMALQRMDKAVEFGLAQQVDIDAKVDNKVRLWRNGVQEQYEMADPLFVDAFAGLESIALPSLSLLSKITNVFRQSVVLNPLFGVLQVPQDAIAAIYTSGLQPRYAFTIPARAAKEFVQTLLTPERSKVHRELRAFGAVGARDTTADVIRMDLEIMEGAKSSGTLPQRLWRPVSKALHHVAMASDAAVRQAVYTAAMDQGLSQAEALEKAFQLINFRNRGTSKELALAARVIPFLNAYVAAQHVAYKTLSGQGISPTDRKAAMQTLAATTLGMMGLTMLYAMLNGGDEGYEKRPLYVRDRVFVIPGTDGISIPMRADVFAFPKVFAEHLWQHITDSGTIDGANTRRSMKDLLVSSFIGPYAPQAIKPAVEVAINYDFFRQRPLVGASMRQAATEYQFADSTSELGKLVGQSGLISPIAFDHLMRGYLGSLGGLILYTSNQLGNTLNGVPRPDLPLWDAIASFPGASTVLPKQNDSAMRQDFYELKEAVDRVTQTLSLLNGRNPEALDAYLDNENVMERYELSSEVNAVYRDMLEIRKEISQIRNDRSLTAAEKQAEIQALQEEELEILRSMDLKELRKEANL